MISVIIPAYNEERSIQDCFQRIYNVLSSKGYDFEILLEQDGSSDRTPHIIEELARRFDNVHALSFSERRGKGFGIRKCLERARGEIAVIIDADLEYPPEKIPEMVEKIRRTGTDIVVAQRVNAKRSLLRKVLSSFYRLILKILFGKDFIDPQSGLKVIRRAVIEEIWPIRSDGFEIDSEILIRAHEKGFKISYVPIAYVHRGNSKVSVLDPIKMLLSLIKWRFIWLRGKRVS
ncbi:MAG TPA: glycosyltransferase family 2 protein [Candidatus Korarchaeota archaeon]|nr:glycosyltransferase family 2 protein [Candidatus Korarchaeota archaeon]